MYSAEGETLLADFTICSLTVPVGSSTGPNMSLVQGSSEKVEDAGRCLSVGRGDLSGVWSSNSERAIGGLDELGVDRKITGSVLICSSSSIDGKARSCSS